MIITTIINYITVEIFNFLIGRYIRNNYYGRVGEWLERYLSTINPVFETHHGRFARHRLVNV